jgi:hypothetical protein
LVITDVTGPIGRPEKSVTNNLRCVTSITSDLSTHTVAYQALAPCGCELPKEKTYLRFEVCATYVVIYSHCITSSFVHVADTDHRLYVGGLEKMTCRCSIRQHDMAYMGTMILRLANLFQRRFQFEDYVASMVL